MGKTIPICCGVDVHKKFLVATILTGDYLIPQCKQKHFGTSFRNLLAFKQWLLENNCKDVCKAMTKASEYIPEKSRYQKRLGSFAKE